MKLKRFSLRIWLKISEASTAGKQSILIKFSSSAKIYAISLSIHMWNAVKAINSTVFIMLRVVLIDDTISSFGPRRRVWATKRMEWNPYNYKCSNTGRFFSVDDLETLTFWTEDFPVLFLYIRRKKIVETIILNCLGSYEQNLFISCRYSYFEHITSYFQVLFINFFADKSNKLKIPAHTPTGAGTELQKISSSEAWKCR